MVIPKCPEDRKWEAEVSHQTPSKFALTQFEPTWTQLAIKYSKFVSLLPSKQYNIVGLVK